MKTTNVFIIALFILGVTFLHQEASFSQEAAPKEAQVEQETEWLWGEVVSIDEASGKITIKYLNYENDTEEQATLTVSEKTVYENTTSLSQIKPNDTVSIDYIISNQGEKIIKTINLEKPEEEAATLETGKVNQTETAVNSEVQEEATAVESPEVAQVEEMQSNNAPSENQAAQPEKPVDAGSLNPTTQQKQP